MLLIAAFFILLRLAAYFGWVCLGFALLRPTARRAYAVSAAAGLAVARLLAGLLAAYAVFRAGEPAYLLPSMRLSAGMFGSYAALHVAPRIILWGLVGLVILYGGRASESGEGVRRFGAAAAWLAGGVALSCLLDLPMIGVERYFSR